MKSEGPMMSGTIQINQGAIVGYERLLIDLQNFKTSNMLEKAQILQEIVMRNTQSLYQFLDLFKNSLDQTSSQGLFSLLVELINNYKQLDQDSKSRVLLSAFSFYSGEVLKIDQDLLRESCILLIKQPNVLQALGISNYVFINEVSSFAFSEDIVKKLERGNSNIILLMGGTFNAFEIDSQVRRLIPSSMHILNVPFIQALKRDCGLSLIRDIPPACTPYFVKICALCHAQSPEDLFDYISQTRAAFLQKLELIDENSMLCFMQGLSEKLEARDPQWVSNTEKIKRLQYQLIEAQVDKSALIGSAIIKNCLNGDSSELLRILHLPKTMEDFTEETNLKLLTLFDRVNNDHPLVKQFNEKHNQNRLSVSHDLEQLHQVLGFKLYSSQILCINYIIDNLKLNHLIHFGIGNGKTLLCISLAILLANTYNHSVFVVSKNEHLVQRDFVKYEKIIKGLGLSANLNGFANDKGIYFFTLPQLKKQFNNQKMISIWDQSVVIVDEYDWILLDGSVDNVVNLLKFFRNAHSVIGFSGSNISLTEEGCLKLALNTTPVLFPSLDQLKGDLKTQLADVLVSTNQSNYIAKLREIIGEQVKYSPVIIVAQENYRLIDQGLSGCGRDFYALSRNASSVIESVIEGRYLMRNAQKQYGVYLLNEAHGRGTDIQTNEEINSNGGSFLIIADIFSRRSEQQIIGRIGRLNTKGKWQRVLYRQGVKDSADQLLFVEQNSAELQLNQKYCKVQSLLQELREQDTMSEKNEATVVSADAKQSEKEIEKALNAGEQKENPEVQVSIKEVLKDVEESKKQPTVEEDKHEIEEEAPQVESSKLGFYSPSLIEVIENTLAKNPALANDSHEQIQEKTRMALKRNITQVSKGSSRSRSNSKSSKKSVKRGRPKKGLQDFFEEHAKERKEPPK